MNVKNSKTFKAFIATTMIAFAMPAVADRNDRNEWQDKRSSDSDSRHDNRGRNHSRDGDRNKNHNRAQWQGEIRHFDRHDHDVWRGGKWRHESHNGRLGWWWTVSGVWYLYPQAVYPYPDPYVPPSVVTQGAPQVSVAPQEQFWYFCADSNTYYPYVSSCASGWQAVPATPEPTVPDGAPTE